MISVNCQDKVKSFHLGRVSSMALTRLARGCHCCTRSLLESRNSVDYSRTPWACGDVQARRGMQWKVQEAVLVGGSTNMRVQAIHWS